MEKLKKPQFVLHIKGLTLGLCLCLLELGANTVVYGAQPEQPPPIVEGGKIDLSHWNFTKDGVITLQGEWQFYWQQLLEPKDFVDGKVPQPTHLVSIPGGWIDGKSLQEDEESALPTRGYGTYLIKVKGIKQGAEDLGAFLGGWVLNYRVIIFSPRDIQKINLEMTAGVAASSEQRFVAHRLPKYQKIGFLEDDQYYLLIQHSDFYGNGGNFSDPIQLGLLSDLKAAKESSIFLSALTIGMLLIALVYSLSLFLQRREDIGSLYLSLFCLMAVVRFTWTEALIEYFLEDPQIIKTENILRTGSATSFMMVGLIIAFYRDNFNEAFSKNFTRLGWIYSTIAMIACFVSPARNVLSGIIPIVFMIGMIFVILTLYKISLTAIKGDKAAQYAVAGWAVLFSAMTNDFLVGMFQLYEAPWLGGLGYIGFIIFQSQIVGVRFAISFKRNQHLTENLKDEVKKQTIALEEKSKIAIRAKAESDLAHLETLAAKKESDEAHQEAEQLRQKAESQAEELRTLDKQKTAFFQNMSHELRTPLTLILNPLEHQASVQPDNREIQIAAKNSRRLLRLVNQLLDFQKLEAGKKELVLAPLDLNHFTFVCSDYFSSACSTKNITFSVKRDEQPLSVDADPLWILGEIDAIEKIIFNYLSNALKFTDQGERIELGLKTRGNLIRLYVTDTGRGISSEDQTKLFQVFSQVDESTTREFEGTGLGLALVKSLGKEMHAEVGVDSEPGRGSTFWIDFPLSVGIKPITDILLVEDDEDLRQTLMESFATITGMEDCEAVTSAEEAWEALERTNFRCVLSDHHLPGKNGIELFYDISQTYPQVKKVLFTGAADLQIMQRALNEDILDLVFYKPLKSEELFDGLKGLLRESSIQKEVELDRDFKCKPWLIESGISKNNEDDHIDELPEGGEGELILIVDDLADMRELIAADLKRKNYRVLTACNGKQGLEIANQYKPDLIVTDWMMPEMSGPDLIKNLKADPNLGSIPCILLTAKTDDESKLIGTEIGADCFLGKPFNEKELTSVVKNLLSLKASEKEVKSLNLQLTENVLKRYLPPDLVDQIVSGEVSIEQEPDVINATILFSDLVDFTKLTEKIRAKKLSRILNEYLELMNEIIFEHGGTIDKFIGDAIMVIFGAPKAMDAKQQAINAAQCALAMQDGVKELNARWSAEKIPEISMRIGIHQGSVVVGTFGSKRRSDYTAIGSVVNVASRIEGLCEAGKVYLSGEVCDCLPEAMVEEIGAFDLKGITGSRNLYKLAG